LKRVKIEKYAPVTIAGKPAQHDKPGDMLTPKQQSQDSHNVPVAMMGDIESYMRSKH
jgi:hypothetical protein